MPCPSAAGAQPIPASALQAKVEEAMGRALPELAEAANAQAVAAVAIPEAAPQIGTETVKTPGNAAVSLLREATESGIIETEAPPPLTTEEAVREWIMSGACSKVLRIGRQRVHIPGTKEYEDNVAKYARRGEYGPSTLGITEQQAEALGRKYMGTGKVFIRRSGWDGTETITEHNGTVGKAINNLTGATASTTVFKIHYGRRGFHITPDYPSKKQKGGD